MAPWSQGRHMKGRDGLDGSNMLSNVAGLIQTEGGGEMSKVAVSWFLCNPGKKNVGGVGDEGM